MVLSLVGRGILLLTWLVWEAREPSFSLQVLAGQPPPGAGLARESWRARQSSSSWMVPVRHPLEAESKVFPKPERPSNSQHRPYAKNRCLK